ncbi:MAG: 3-oxoacyl-ACP synthase, partial [Winogradskyella sp.]|uniref:3-oxoacyl-ACP synthase n=1 Tax=Winogradskyella sp. TaxID=1883156 RepID=UPI00179949A0|nr:3-oxoacyl-ACP synthase [Winogradskyella sp.]
MKIKRILHKQCQEFLDKRLAGINRTITDIQNSLQSETKSSAGDKHETGRAMLQLEREKAGQQLAEVQKLQETLKKIKLSNTSTKVILGSLVYTSGFNYFIAISAGEMTVEREKFYAISPLTPIGKLLMSTEIGDSIHFRNSTFKII